MPNAPGTLTPERLEEAVATIEQATESLTKTRAEMDAANKKVGELLTQQEDLKKKDATHDELLKKIEVQLANIAAKMESVAHEHTNLSDRLRTSMKEVGASGQADDKAFIYRHPNSKGAIFQSRQQATEIGMFFMATMGRDTAVRGQARRWLNERKADLRYLPNIPKSFVEEFGGDWLRKLQEVQKGALVTEDLTAGATPGSVLTRPEFVQSLIRNVEEHGKFRQNALIWPMGADTVYFPRRKSGFSAPGWEGEGEAGSEVDPDFDQVTMQAKKMFNLHQHSSELTLDAVISLADILMFEIALQIATEEDRIGFNGDGTGGVSPGFAGFIGVLGMTRNGDTAPIGPIAVTGAAGSDLSTEVTLAKLRAMTGQLHTWARGGAKWYMHRTILADLMGISDGNWGSVVKFTEGRVASIMGYPVEEVEGMPVSPSAASTAQFALGDLRRSWILGDRTQVEIQTSEHYAFNTDQLTYRWKKRMAVKPVQPNGMVVYVGGTA